MGENEEWGSNENDAEHGKWEWATGGIQTVSARKLHTKSNDVQSYFSQVLCSRHKLQAITLTPPHPPVQLTPAHTLPLSLPHLPSCSGNMSCSCCFCRLHMGPCGHVAVWILVNLWLVVCMSPACRLPPSTPLLSPPAALHSHFYAVQMTAIFHRAKALPNCSNASTVPVVPQLQLLWLLLSLLFLHLLLLLLLVLLLLLFLL